MAEQKNTTKNKLGAIARKKEAKKIVAPKAVIQEVKQAKKVGRPTFKEEGTNYVRVYTQIPELYRDKIKISLITHFKGTYKTQDEVINQAITDFLHKHGLL